ncbi:MAG: SDR family oxidoreductase [Solirubrobacterales bacterium]
MIEVAIAGGHGKIGLMLGRLLVERGNAVWGLIRSPGQEDDLHAVGVEPVLCDLEADHDVATAVRGADAVVFAAGAGPGSGAERKWTMDYGGALKLIEAARAEGVGRYVMISAMGAAEPPAEGGDVHGEYLRAKAEADKALEASGLDYTIVRPGSLTDEPPTGRVEVGSRLDRGQIPRADVAAVLAAVLTAENSIGKVFDLVSGETPIELAVAGL